MASHTYTRRLLPLCFLPALITAATAQDKPNILIIHTDEHNFRTLGCYRECLQNEQAFPWGEGVTVETPNVDYLAHRGVLFTRCYATSPVSSPSRASFMTGLYPQHNGVWTNDMELSDEAVTFGEVMRRNGYATGYFGKLHINGKGRPEWQPERDFGFSDNRYMYNRGHWKKITEPGGKPAFQPDAPVQTTDSLTFPTDYFTNRAIEFIGRHQAAPFCCMVCFPDPHSANLVRTPYDTLYTHLPFRQPRTASADTAGMPAWAHGSGLKEDLPEDMAQYFGMIKCIDDNVGRLLDALRQNGLLENTLVVFTSDHGDMCGQHGLINKGVPLDDSARVPFIVSYPAGMRSGLRIGHVMSVTDFTPSLLSFCGLPVPAGCDGRDLSPLWKGEKLPTSYPDIVFMRAITPKIKSDWDESATAMRTQWVSAVTPRYKLTYSEYAPDAPWLTDLEKDPDETQNRYADPDYRQIVSRLATALKAYGERYDDPRTGHPKIRKEIEEAISKE
ncbi:MAG: sulfatase [Parabacteroides sp.]|nr:sulfatase [Parabacteroides sp.]